jgi:hypothetical protein
VAWWNVENLFDEENSPRRTEKLNRVIGNDLVGWTPQLRDRKISQLADVIAQMNQGAGPDLLGVCEVENRFVLDLLATALADRLDGRRYEIVHADTDDARGIDVAFLYDPTLLAVPAGEVFFHVVMRRNATREIVQVNFTSRGGRTWAVFGNHWPSRSGGQHESAGYRAIAGETLAYFHQRAREVHGEDTPALAMVGGHELASLTGHTGWVRIAAASAAEVTSSNIARSSASARSQAAAQQEGWGLRRIGTFVGVSHEQVRRTLAASPPVVGE